MKHSNDINVCAAPHELASIKLPPLKPISKIQAEDVSLAKESLFDLGKIVIYPRAINTLAWNEISNALQRHARGDWGEADTKTKAENNIALTPRSNQRVYSEYRSRDGHLIAVYTMFDRSSTTLRLRGE